MRLMSQGRPVRILTVVLTGVNQDLHTPGTQDNDPVLALSVTAALRAWARPYAMTG